MPSVVYQSDSDNIRELKKQENIILDRINDLGKVANKYEEDNKKIKDLSDLLLEKEKSIVDIDSVIKEKESELEHIEKNISDISIELNNTINEVNKRKKDIKESDVCIDKKTDQLITLQTQIEQGQKTVKELQLKIKVLESEKEGFEKGNSILYSKNVSLNESIPNVESRVNEVLLREKEVIKSCELKEKELKDLNNSIKVAEDKVKDVEFLQKKKETELKEIISKLEIEINKLKISKKDAEKENEEYTEKIRSERNKFNKYKEWLEQDYSKLSIWAKKAERFGGNGIPDLPILTKYE